MVFEGCWTISSTGSRAQGLASVQVLVSGFTYTFLLGLLDWFRQVFRVSTCVIEDLGTTDY